MRQWFITTPLFSFERVLLDGADGARLRDVSGDIPDHCLTVLVGLSGAGKSSVLRLANRLEVPSSGTVRFRGNDIRGLDPLVLRRRVGMVFQRPTPFGGDVVDNLRVANSDLDRIGAQALLENVGLDSAMLDRPAADLSGGELQRVCLARTLATSPDVLLMDEPTGSLDHRSRSVLESLARKLVMAGQPMVWVTHDFMQMRRIADHVIVLDAGRIVHASPLATLDATAPPAVAEFLDEHGSDEGAVRE